MIFPLITPIDISDGNYNITSGTVCISTIVKRNGNDRLVIIPLSNNIGRLYQIGNNILLLEDIITFFMTIYIGSKTDISTIVTAGIIPFNLLKGALVTFLFFVTIKVYENIPTTIKARFS